MLELEDNVVPHWQKENITFEFQHRGAAHIYVHRVQ